MGKPKKSDVERNEGGVTGKGFMPGQSGNPGGMTSHQAAVRRDLLTWLSSEPVTAAFKKSLLALIEEKNPTIMAAVGDRLMGKVKVHVEVSGDPEQPLAPLDTQAIIDALTKGKP
jgi:hypothetical protein